MWKARNCPLYTNLRLISLNDQHHVTLHLVFSSFFKEVYIKKRLFRKKQKSFKTLFDISNWQFSGKYYNKICREIYRKKRWLVTRILERCIWPSITLRFLSNVRDTTYVKSTIPCLKNIWMLFFEKYCMVFSYSSTYVQFITIHIHKIDVSTTKLAKSEPEFSG